MKNLFHKFFILYLLMFCVTLAYLPDGLPGTFKTDKKLVALTFDDGPYAEITPKILAILNEHQVKATFFLIGYSMIKHPEMVRDIRLAGHELGNHTFDHVRLDFFYNQDMSEQLSSVNDLYYQILGEHPKWFRPPGGRYNRMVAEVVKKNNLKALGWSINANDFLYANQVYSELDLEEKIQRSMLLLKNNLAPGSIILMHNGNKLSVALLPQIIDYVYSQGYEFVTISEIESLLDESRRVTNDEYLIENN